MIILACDTSGNSRIADPADGRHYELLRELQIQVSSPSCLFALMHFFVIHAWFWQRFNYVFVVLCANGGEVHPIDGQDSVLKVCCWL